MALQIVTKLKTLAQQPENRPVIVRDQGCVPGLVMFLDNEDAKVVSTSLEVLHLLSMHDDNKSILAKEKGLVLAVKKLMLSRDNTMKAAALSTYTNLQGHINAGAATSASKVLAARATSRSNGGQRNKRSNRRGSNAFFSDKVNTKLNTARTFNILIKGLTSEESRTKVEGALVRVKGVISFLVDLYAQKITVRAMTTAETIISAIKKNTGMVATLEGGGDDENNENQNGNDYPDYLPESGAPVKVAKGSLVMHGSKPSEQAGWGSYISSWWG
eukprot:TRINITY_DN3961_c0_g1_i8.p1 TRINITY_DN3961_c0_g1~~TRINITY_DN3961_c0_g1_i8.p1  ORF type:complete len:273 (+),score=74.15 TRINITY_DN3961_c0_g1_i8:261-1079(+)